MIGIPRGLYFFHNDPFWQIFLEGLGFQVVVSPATNREILELGLRNCVDGACLPLKAYFGHVHTLIGQGITELFIPQIVSVQQREYTCPTFLGLPDLLTQTLPSQALILSPILNGLKGVKKLKESYFRFGLEYASHATVGKSWKRAQEAQEEYGRRLKFERKERGKNLTILLLGPRYLTEDHCLNGQLVQELNSLGVDVLRPSECNECSPSFLSKPLFWSEARRSLGALEELLTIVDGVISLAPFGCGAEALLSVLVEQKVKEKNIPRLVVHLDEHTSALGVGTRLEAFYDLLERKALG